MVKKTIESIPEDTREDYRKKFIEELRIYPLKGKKRDQPTNSGCIHELSDMDELDVEDPVSLAKLVKEGIHLMYQ